MWFSAPQIEKCTCFKNIFSLCCLDNFRIFLVFLVNSLLASCAVIVNAEVKAIDEDIAMWSQDKDAATEVREKEHAEYVEARPTGSHQFIEHFRLERHSKPVAVVELARHVFDPRCDLCPRHFALAPLTIQLHESDRPTRWH